MQVRLLTFTGIRDIDGVVSYLRDGVLPIVSRQKGYGGMTASADRARGIFGSLSLWATAADREASFGALEGARDEARSRFGGTLEVEALEQLVAEVGPVLPEVGSALIVQRIKMDPGVVDDNVAFFKEKVVPQIKSAPGFLSLRNLINRQTGEGVVGTVWRDDASMKVAADVALDRRPLGEARGVTFGETSFREIVFVAMS